MVLDKIWKNSPYYPAEIIVLFSYFLSKKWSLSLWSGSSRTGGGETQVFLCSPLLELCWFRVETSTALDLPQGLLSPLPGYHLSLLKALGLYNQQVAKSTGFMCFSSGKQVLPGPRWILRCCLAVRD